jgi:hypothetical protein
MINEEDGQLYFRPDKRDDRGWRKCIPLQLRQLVLEQYHDKNGHTGKDKTIDAIKLKYHWSGIHKSVFEYVEKCQVCKLRKMKEIKCLLPEMDVPKFPMQKDQHRLVSTTPNDAIRKYIHPAVYRLLQRMA